jgi:Zn-dependent protease/CBS domain-containing protein
MGGGFRFGRIFGIELRIDWGLFIIFWLVAVTLGSGLFPAQHPEWSPLLTWSVALLAATLFFASVLAHEMSHALVARSFGIPVESITLFIFGGVANMKREPDSPKAELAVAAVGPATSIVIGILASTLGSILAGPSVAAAAVDEALLVTYHAGPLATLLLWLGPVNVILGLFNLVPGFPLDGGRVLRALLWSATKDLRKATLWASKSGQAFGFLLIFLGISMAFGFRAPFLGGGWLNGIWLAFIGWFLNNAAAASYQHVVVVKELLEDVPVTRLMRPNPAAVSPETTIETLVDEFLMATDQRAFPVTVGDRLVGIVCLQDVRKVPRAQWSLTTVGEVMTPREQLSVVTPEESAADAFQKLAGTDFEQLPVVSNGHLEGVVRRRDVMRWLELQQIGESPAYVAWRPGHRRASLRSG